MKTRSYLLALTVALCGLAVVEPSASAPTNITGTWEVTIHYEPDDRDYRATYVLKQEGEKITGTYQGMYGPADVVGTIKSSDVALSVTVKGSTARFSGKVASSTTMSGTVTGTSDKPRNWSAQKKADPKTAS
jgi:hypothetical protein